MARITVTQLAARFDTLEDRLNAILDAVEINAPAKAPAKAAKAPAYIPVMPVLNKFPSLIEIEKALQPDQCQYWAHRKHDGTAKAKDSYRDNMPALIVQCNKQNCSHVPGEFRPDRYYTGPLGYHAERAEFHNRWRAEFGPVSEKAGQ